MTIYKVEMWNCHWVDDYTCDGYEDWSIVREIYFRDREKAEVCVEIWKEERGSDNEHIDELVRIKEVKVL